MQSLFFQQPVPGHFLLKKIDYWVELGVKRTGKLTNIEVFQKGLHRFPINDSISENADDSKTMDQARFFFTFPGRSNQRLYQFLQIFKLLKIFWKWIFQHPINLHNTRARFTLVYKSNTPVTMYRTMPHLITAHYTPPFMLLPITPLSITLHLFSIFYYYTLYKVWIFKDCRKLVFVHTTISYS